MADGFPRKFGKYHLLSPLAQGGMGALYLAVTGDRGLEKLCVIKTVLPHLADAEYVSRFRDEAKVVVKLSHGNLVPVFDAGQVGGEIFLAMDFVEGKDLRAVWNRCAKKTVAFPVDVAVHIVKELCRGLAYAHAYSDLKLVHRDVSPPNVLISFSGEVKLTDFGLASSTLKLEKTAPGVIYGKVSYMSPEQARGEPLDGRTDLYAAGIILWELLTGRQLFPPGEAQPQDLIARAKDPRPDPPSKRAPRVPPQLDAIVLKALEADPTKRYQSGEEMRSALANWLATEAPSTDAARLEKFVTGLFAEDVPRERKEREALIGKTRERLTAPSSDERMALVPSDRTEPAPRGMLGMPPTAPSKSAPTVPPGPVAPQPSAITRRGEPTQKGVAVSVPAPGPGGATVVPTRPVSDGAMQALAEKLDEDPDFEPEPSPEEIVGQIVQGRYAVRALIGEGGMGRVYEAEHVDIGKRVALKILHPVYSRTPDVVARFRREARAASKIGHPNIVDVTDSGATADGSVYFVMEYLEGVELAAVIDREGAIDIHRALGIGTQICRALAAAHSAGIIHRDLKPENVFLIVREGTTDFVKVLDFGIAKSAELEEQRKERLTHPGMAMGTPEYMAPEQAAGKPADARSDVYAVGAILYEMLTGRPPYEGENFMEILTKKATVEPVPPRDLRPDLPEVVEKVVLRAMARDPAERPRSMEALEYELTKCLAGRGVAVAKMLGMPVDSGMGGGNNTSPMQPMPPMGPPMTDMPSVPTSAEKLAAVAAGVRHATGGHTPLPGNVVAQVSGAGLAGSAPTFNTAQTAIPASVAGDTSRHGPSMPIELTPEERRAYRIGARFVRGWLLFLFLLIAGGAGATYWYYLREPRPTSDASLVPDEDGRKKTSPVTPRGKDKDRTPDEASKHPAPRPEKATPGEEKPPAKPDEKPPVVAKPEKPEDKPPVVAKPEKPEDKPPVVAKPEKPEEKPAVAPKEDGKPPRDKKEAKALLTRARSAEASRKYPEARQLYERVASGKHMRVDGLLGIANVAWQTKDVDGAIQFAQKAIDEGAGDSARLLLGHAYYKKGRFDDAISMYKAVLKNDPKNAEALKTLRAAERQKSGGSP